MPARVHAILVVRPDGRTPARVRMSRTLAALAAQTRPADAVTVVVCGRDAGIAERAAEAAVEGVLSFPAKTSFARAVAMASLRVAPDSAVWLLAQDTVPAPDALQRLAGALELSDSIAVVAPKLVREVVPDQIVSLGESITPSGRTVELAEGELDQGQHDDSDDVLGADVRGMLVRADVWRELGGLDPALAGADEGLDFGIRARRAGGRVCVVPQARVSVAGDGVAGLPEPRDAATARRRVYASRTAYLHRTLVYARAPLVPLLWLAILPLALWRTAVHLVLKRPQDIVPEWGASFTAAWRWRALHRARRRIARHRVVSWRRLAPLRTSRYQLRRRLEGDASLAPERPDLRFFSGGGAWSVLAALVVSIAAFPALLAWRGLGGGALLPLGDSIGTLWSDAMYGQRPTGWESFGPADPFSAIIATVASTTPWAPPTSMVVLWILALPLAVLGGWFATTRISDRSGLRILGGILWALAPTFLVALVDARPTAVIVHLLLPWLFFCASVAHRSWGAAGAASLLLLAVVACAPSTAPALSLLWIAAVVLSAIVLRGRGLARVVWLVIPSAVVFAPLAIWQVTTGNAWGLIADPGAVWAGPSVPADGMGRVLMALGFPTGDPGGWGAFLGSSALWAAALVLPTLVLALAAPMTRRWNVGYWLLGIGAAGIATAFAAVAVSVSFDAGRAVPVWPGPALSLAWVGVAGGALTTLDAGTARVFGAVRPIAAVVAAAALVVLAVPSLTAMARGATVLTAGEDSTLPAYVAAVGREDPSIGTLVITPQSEDSVAAEVVWGATETLAGTATIQSTQTTPEASDPLLAQVTADLIASTDPDAVDALTSTGIGFILLQDPVTDAGAADSLLLSASTHIDQRDAVVAVGRTERGTLWRTVADPAPRAMPDAAERGAARTIVTLQLGVVLVALLLSVPTAASIRDARRRPRIVGGSAP